MADDTQRRLWAKLPGADTGIEVRKSVCTICDPATQCGLDLYVRGGRIVKVEGSKENPGSRGTLCSKGAATRQYVYHEDRLLTPLRRTGPRGSGSFEPVSWDEALEAVVAGLERVRAESGPESVVFYVGYPKHMRPFVQRLALQWGSPNFCTESSVCFTAVSMAFRLVYGQLAGPDVRNTRCCLVWGANPFHARSPAAAPLMDALDRGSRLVVVDPRRTQLAARADVHLQLRPGTDGALALGMAHVILDEGLHDAQFCAVHTRGFDEYREYVRRFDPDTVAGITGVPADKVRAAARLYAATAPAALVFSAAPLVQHTSGVQNARAVFTLIGLTGNYDVTGGNKPAPYGWLEVSGAGFTSRQHEFEMPRRWDDLPPRVGAERFPVWSALIDQAQAMDLPRQIRSGDPYPVRAMVAFGLNHRMFPGSDRFLDAVRKLDFICDVDLFATDSSRYADVVLPACSSVERSELRAYQQKWITLTEPAIAPLGESRSDTDIVVDLAHRLGLDDPLLNPEPGGGADPAAMFPGILDWILAPSGMTVDEIGSHPGGMPVGDPIPTPDRRYLEQGFPTPSGKMEFASSVLERLGPGIGVDALPAWTPPACDTVGAGMERDYPFILNAGSRLPMFIHSRTYRLPWTRGLRPLPMADINPADAAALGVAQGDRIELSSPAGSIRVLANLTELVRPGDIHMCHSHPEADVNLLLDPDALDPVSGFPGYRSARCRVDRVGDRDPSGGPEATS